MSSFMDSKKLFKKIVSECNKLWFTKQKAWSDRLQRHWDNVTRNVVQNYKSFWTAKPRRVFSSISSGGYRVQFYTMFTYVHLIWMYLKAICCSWSSHRQTKNRINTINEAKSEVCRADPKPSNGIPSVTLW